MLSAKIFENGRSQAVRLPKEKSRIKREKNYEIYVGYKYMHIYNKE